MLLLEHLLIKTKFMKKKMYLITLITFLFVQLATKGNDCNNVYKKCKSPEKDFTLSSSSRSVKIRKGKKSRIVLNVYGGRTYYFSLYSKTKAGALQFKVIDPESNSIIYDNSVEALTDNKTITVDHTHKLYIDLFAPNWKSQNSYECAGFKVAYLKK